MKGVLALGIASMFVPVRIEGGSIGIDADAVARGVALRLDHTADDWTITVVEHDAGSVRVRLTSPEATVLERVIPSEGDSDEARSRALAAAIALLIEDASEEQSPVPAPTVVPPERSPRFVLGLTGSVNLGPIGAVDPAGGIGLEAGTFVAREHVLPLVEIDWQHARAGALVVDAVRIGGGVAVGSGIVHARLWLGAAAIVRAEWAEARERARAEAWSSSTFVGALGQVRARRVYVGARLGVDLTAPPLRFIGGDGLRFGTVRFAAGIVVGGVVPRRSSSR